MAISEKIELIKGDITRLDTEAVVNAANSSLKGGGGVDGAIHRAAGPKLADECMTIIQKRGGCPTGESVITSAGNMPSKFVIHAVGPVWSGGNNRERELLRLAYRSSMETAELFGIKSLAFPNIGTGAYGFPKEEAAKIAVDAVNDYLQESDFVEKVIFCCFDEDNYRLYKEYMEKTAD